MRQRTYGGVRGWGSNDSLYSIASIVAFCKLEIMKVATATNHFAIKYKLLVAANIASMNELVNLRENNVFA